MSSVTPEWDIVRSQGERVFDDLEYFVKYRVYDHRVELEVWRCGHYLTDTGARGEMFYQGPNGPVDSLEEADLVLEGHVKWDGCSNWDFHPDDEGVADDGKTQWRHMHHWCERDELVKFGELLGRLWDMGSLMSSWSP